MLIRTLATALLLATFIPDSPTLMLMDGKIQVAAVQPHALMLSPAAPPLLDWKRFKALSTAVARQTEKASINARIDANGSIRPGHTGRTLLRSVFQQRLYRAICRRKVAKVALPFIRTYPRVDVELLSQLRAQSIGSCTTYFNSADKSRTHNIALAARALDSYVLFPDETFSFNRIVGMRTEKKGYRRARVILSGEYGEDIGGGVCQVSSTLFNAAARAGLPITQRLSHSRRVPYVPPGHDAAVSWPSPDLQFRNPYKEPVLIRASSGDGWIRLTFYASESLFPRRPCMRTAPLKYQPHGIFN
ncbi:MAG: VanW family protein [Sporolactobacillus sp.]